MRDFKHLHDPDRLYQWEKKPSKFKEVALDVCLGGLAGLALGILVFIL
jgi:hypothetical protein